MIKQGCSFYLCSAEITGWVAEGRREPAWRLIVMALLPMNTSLSANWSLGRIGRLQPAGVVMVWSPSHRSSSAVVPASILSRLDRGFFSSVEGSSACFAGKPAPTGAGGGGMGISAAARGFWRAARRGRCSNPGSAGRRWPGRRRCVRAGCGGCRSTTAGPDRGGGSRGILLRGSGR